MHNVGIDLLSFYAPTEYLDLADLADARGVAPEKYEIGLDQRLMSCSGCGRGCCHDGRCSGIATA